MKQIKTIIERNAADFDREVNKALKEGWRMKKRIMNECLNGTEFVALLEKDEGTCDDCRFRGGMLTDEPCNECGANYEKWQAEVQAEDQK